MTIFASHDGRGPRPGPVERAAEAMSGFGGAWLLCGGWGVDAWLGGQSRDHHDVDIAVFEDELDGLASYLAGWSLVAHDAIAPDDAEPWRGRRLELPAHIHARREDDFELEFCVNRRSGDVVMLSLEPPVATELKRFAGRSRWGLLTLAPEAILFYKALELRPQDEEDFGALAPHLTGEQRSWLRGAIARLQRDHPWLARLHEAR